MKRTRTVLLFLILITALLCAGCANSAPAGGSNSSASPAPTIEPTPAAAENMPITVAYEADTPIDSNMRVDGFAASENGERLVFTTTSPVTDFKVIAVGYRDDGPELSFFEYAVLYEMMGDFYPEVNAFILTTEIPEIIPTHGISFTDETGETRRFCISLSGFDGSVFLIEF